MAAFGQGTVVSVLLFLSITLYVANPVTSNSNGETRIFNIQGLIGSKSRELTVPAGHGLQEVLFAEGYQIYDFNGTNWVLLNATADLYNFKGNKVGHHYFLTERDANGGQPTWETYNPASRVTVKSLASVPQEDSINWLLTEATGNSGSRKLLGSTTFVQRVYTQHGLQPSPDTPAKIGDIYASPYTSLYNFFSRQAQLQY